MEGSRPENKAILDLNFKAAASMPTEHYFAVLPMYDDKCYDAAFVRLVRRSRIVSGVLLITVTVSHKKLTAQEKGNCASGEGHGCSS